MKNKENIIKKVKHGLKVAAATALIAVSLTSCANVQTSFSSQDEIVQTSEFLDCDTSYMAKQNGDFVRMKHNNGEPIYVCFDEEYSDKYKAVTKESLDYVFGIVGKINNNYHYEIVDKKTFDSKINKTKIYYTYGKEVIDRLGNKNEVDGYAESYSAWYNYFTDNPVMNYYEINISKDVEENRLLLTYVHENMHLFGFKDVYTNEALKTTEKHYGNTFMNVNMCYDILTPNDLACLISLYSDENTDMVRMKQELQKYETKFYNYYAKLCKEKLKTTEDVDYENFVWFGGIVRINEDGTSVGTDYKLTVENGSYTLQLIDANTKEEVDCVSGETTIQNGVVILKNVELKKGLYLHNEFDCYEGGYIQDLAVITKDGITSLYNHVSNDFLYGGYVSLEKGLTQ